MKEKERETGKGGTKGGSIPIPVDQATIQEASQGSHDGVQEIRVHWATIHLH